MPAVLVDREADLAALARRAAVLAVLGFLWLGIPVDAFAADASADAGEAAVVVEETSSDGTASDGTATDASTDSTATETATEPVADDASAESPAAEPTPVPEPPPAESPPASEPAPAPEPAPVLDSSPAPEPAPPAPEAVPPEPAPPATSGTPPSPPGPPAAQAPSIVLLPESPPPVSEIVQGLAPPLVQLAGDPRTGSRARQGGDSGIPLREAEQPSKVASLPLAGDNGHAPVPGGATGGASGAPSAGLDIALTFLVALALLGSGGLLLPLVAQLRPFALVSQLNRPG
jgi:hypothetical protein